MNGLFYWINIQVVSWGINVWDSKAIQTRYSCTSVTVGIYIFLFQKQRFAEWPHYQTYLASMTATIKSSSNWNICWVFLHKGMSVTVSSKQSLWKGWYGKDFYSMETLVTLEKLDGTSWLTDRATVIAASHWWWMVSDVDWNFSKFNTKYSTVWDVEPLSDGCWIHSEQVQVLGNLKQLQVKENFITPSASATWGPVVPQTEYVWWLLRKGNYSMLSEIKYTKLPHKMYKI